MPDGLEQMGLPQSDSPVDKQGVVRPGGGLGHRQGGGVSKAVPTADDEGVEGVPPGGDQRFGGHRARGRELPRCGNGSGFPDGDHKLHIDPAHEDLLKGLRDQAPVAPFQPFLGEQAGD